MARHIATITYRKSCLIEPNGRCKGFSRMIVNVAVLRDKINQLHTRTDNTHTHKLQIFYLSLEKINLLLLYFDILIYFRVNK